MSTLMAIVRRSGRAQITAGVLALIVLATGQQIWAIRARTLLEFERRAAVASEAAAAYVGQVIGAVTLALQTLDSDLSTPAIVMRGSPADIRQALRRAQDSSPVIQGLGLIGPDGRVRVSATTATPGRIDLSDRPYFAFHRDSAYTGLHIERPVVSRPENMVSIPVSMRAETADGTFDGLVGARLDPRHFSAFFSKLGVDAVNLVDARGNLYARFPDIDLMKAEARPLPGFSNEGPFSIAMPSGEALLGYSTPVAGAGLFVRATNFSSGVAETWLRRATGPILAGFVAACLTLLLSVAVGRRARRVAALLVEKVAGEKDARREAARFRDVARSKSDFLAHMGHELRTPLNAIIGFAEVIAIDAMKLGGPQRYREYAADIGFSADHLLGVINRVLDMSKIEAGKWVLKPGKVSSASLIGTVVNLAAQRAEREKVRIDTSGADMGLAFVGDERTLVQLLLNLTINAIKFAGEDRIVRIACGRLADGRIEFGVSDRGRGMTPEDAARALRPFETARAEGAGERSDTGLALLFAELHGGTLEIETEPGRGTSVWVTLPARPPESV
ncbi:MAG: hypothetical protein HY059_18320 [Proteobacteria bacterium]|nr:hypothetical protein [Pseudomonadota bacterium]